jgi:hypothetical protein
LAVAVIAICLAGYFQLQHFCPKQAHWWHTNGPRFKVAVALSVLPLVLVGPLVMRHLLTIIVVTSAQLMIYAVYRMRQMQAGEEYVEGCTVSSRPTVSPPRSPVRRQSLSRRQYASAGMQGRDGCASATILKRLDVLP